MEIVADDQPSAIERLIRHDRALALAVMAAIVLLAWTYLLREAAAMGSMAAEARMHAAMGMADMRVWDASDWGALFLMWAVMMAGMMLPSATPVLLLVLSVYRRRKDRRARASSAAFLAGYALAWTTFSAAAAGVQVLLHRWTLLTADMRSSSPWLAGGVLLLAGAYQWLPLKNACLTHCHSPFGFLSAYWREGPIGGLGMGLRHGIFCIGCCWMLMALLFAVGVMNLLWVAVIAIVVLIEKTARRGPTFGRLVGVLLCLWGAYVIAGA